MGMWDYELKYNPIEKSLDITPSDYSPDPKSVFLGRLNLPDWLKTIMSEKNNTIPFDEVFEPLPVQEFNRLAQKVNLEGAGIPIIGNEECSFNIHTFSFYSRKKMRLILLPDYFPSIEYDYMKDIINQIFERQASLRDNIGRIVSLSLSHLSDMKSVRMLFPPALSESIYDPNNDFWNKGCEKNNPFAKLGKLLQQK